MEHEHELIICIVNEGFSENAMEAAKSAGAKGGTVINAKGTANKDAERYFNIVIQPKKELIMILVNTKIRDKVLHALYEKVGLATEGRGIAFSLPVDHTAGLNKKAAIVPRVEQQADHKENEIQEKETGGDSLSDKPHDSPQ